MSFLDFLQKKQKREAVEKEKRPVKAAFPPKADSPLAKKDEKSTEMPGKSAGFSPRRGGEDSLSAKNAAAFQIMRRPRITEKAGIVGGQNKYIFEVYKNANKPEVKKAVEKIYGKKVEKVHIVNIPPKKKRRGRIEYYKPGFKKAIVTLKEGETIEIMPR